ncbi:MAG: hypothetical protein ABIC36_02650 [bacterium]
MKKLIFLSFVLLLVAVTGCTKQQEAENSVELSLNVEQKDDMNYLVLYKNGEKTIIKEGYVRNPSDPTNISIFNNPHFSSLKNYVIFDEGIYVGDMTTVYDIKNNKVIGSGSMGKTGVTPDEKYFYQCVSGRGLVGIVKSIPDLNVVLDIFGKQIGEGSYEKNSGYQDLDCNFDDTKKQIIFKLYKDWQAREKGETKYIYYPEK